MFVLSTLFCEGSVLSVSALLARDRYFVLSLFCVDGLIQPDSLISLTGSSELPQLRVPGNCK